MRRRREAHAAALACCLGLTSVLGSRVAHAGEAGSSSVATSYPQIHIGVSPSNSSVVPLLRAELGELGLTCIDGPATSGSSITIYAELSANSLEVRIGDDESGSTLVREVFSVADGQAMDERTAVLHISELLRWHLHYRPAAPEPPRPPPVSPHPLAAAPTEPPPAEFRVGAVPIALYSPGGTRLGLGAELDLFERWRWFGVRALGASSLVPNRTSVAEGALQARSAWAGLEGALVLEPRRDSLELDLGLGVALFTTSLRGAANGTNVGQNDQLVTAAPFVDLRAHQQLAHGLSLVLSSTCLIPAESSGLRVLDRVVAHYGREVLTLGLGLELKLF